ncbi:uncharacterized protein M6B38_378440 [Iris pallida]|uniref:PORR domain-containing protein n=1 Tax=Iris pallida TaxID=29817 RepID=A0AAX6G8T4_IRIPA|nr:uncharacterized protein M6B38_378440 [Iris pallida]
MILRLTPPQQTLSFPLPHLMALALPILHSSFLPPSTISFPITHRRRAKPLTVSSSSSSSCGVKPKLVRCPPLDRHAAAHNRLRFVRKLATLLLSKPRRFLPVRILSRCRRYLSLPPSRPLLPMLRRYPLLFSLSHLPSHSPHSLSLLSVSLTPQFSALASSAALDPSLLASKLQRLLMLSSHRRLLLSKLVHLAPDLGLAPNFRSRLCNSRPDLFRTVDTSFGRALELVLWDPSLALPFPPVATPADNKPIIDRPPKFKQLRLRRGLNLKRRHQDFLIRFQESPEANPYGDSESGGGDDEKERRACAVVREVLMMTTGKRTLVDHLTHFRKEFRLPNRLRAMLVRHPEMFYVSIKGERDSVFLVEAFDDKGRLVVEDEMGRVKERLAELVREGKRLRRERRRGIVGVGGDDDNDGEEEEEQDDQYGDDDGFGDLFEVGIGNDWEEFAGDDGDDDTGKESVEFWSMKEAEEGEGKLEAW